MTDRAGAAQGRFAVARTDPLTGVGSASELMEALDGLLAGPVAPAVLLVDLDSFRQVNERHGLRAGDEVLVEAAGRLRHTAGRAGSVFRVGNDEFALLAPGLSAGAAVRLAERVVAAITGPTFVSGGPPVYVEARVGVATAAGDSSWSLACATAALFAAKSKLATVSAPSRVVLWSEALDAARCDLRQREGWVRSLLAGDGIELTFDPVVDLLSGHLLGAEAHPRLAGAPAGMSEAALWEVAASLGVAVQLGTRILRRACEVGADVSTADPAFAVGVDLCRAQLGDPSLAAAVRTAFDDAGLDAARLFLSLTGAGLHGLSADMISMLAVLQKLGVRTCVADVDAGGTTLADLRTVHVDGVRVSAGLVASAAVDDRAAAALEAVVGVASRFGMSLLATGVASSGQASFAARCGVVAAEGPLFASALSADELLAYATDDAR